jgi:hypothetical protein
MSESMPLPVPVHAHVHVYVRVCVCVHVHFYVIVKWVIFDENDMSPFPLGSSSNCLVLTHPKEHCEFPCGRKIVMLIIATYNKNKVKNNIPKIVK